MLLPGDDLQSALETARRGHVMNLPAEVVFTGLFTLPNKPGAPWITIRSSVPDSRPKPPAKTQAATIHSGVMPKLESAAAPVITAVPGAHHRGFIAIEIGPRPGAFPYRTVSSQRARVSRRPG